MTTEIGSKINVLNARQKRINDAMSENRKTNVGILDQLKADNFDRSSKEKNCFIKSNRKNDVFINNAIDNIDNAQERITETLNIIHSLENSDNSERERAAEIIKSSVNNIKNMINSAEVNGKKLFNGECALNVIYGSKAEQITKTNITKTSAAGGELATALDKMIEKNACIANGMEIGGYNDQTEAAMKKDVKEGINLFVKALNNGATRDQITPYLTANNEILAQALNDGSMPTIKKTFIADKIVTSMGDITAPAQPPAQPPADWANIFANSTSRDTIVKLYVSERESGKSHNEAIKEITDGNKSDLYHNAANRAGIIAAFGTDKQTALEDLYTNSKEITGADITDAKAESIIANRNAAGVFAPTTSEDNNQMGITANDVEKNLNELKDYLSGDQFNKISADDLNKPEFRKALISSLKSQISFFEKQKSLINNIDDQNSNAIDMLAKAISNSKEAIEVLTKGNPQEQVAETIKIIQEMNSMIASFYSQLNQDKSIKNKAIQQLERSM